MECTEIGGVILYQKDFREMFVCLFVSGGIPIRVSSELIFSHRRLIWFLNKSSFHKNGVEFG